ncbi:MAG: pantoate--beta-alanine ligase [Verrucomicrobiota bacterium]|nr:pantoate--beta-alanine ligase [Verrucomicrobiota bacterium]
MEVISCLSEMQKSSLQWEREGKKIGFVPTMGSLHQGHLSLIDLVRDQSDLVILSIFVNPTQFAEGEDLEKYPRDLERDLQLCKEQKVDFVFTPRTEDIYKVNTSTFIVEKSVSEKLCGQFRPSHFKGVTTICAKLFNLCRPTFVSLGQKDAQQVSVLKRMIRDLHFPIEVVVGPIVRETDGLAMSSRNVYLNDSQREDARLIFQALITVKKLVDEEKTTKVDRVKEEFMRIFQLGNSVKVDYAEVVNRNTMEIEEGSISKESLLVVAVWVDSIRLIDNMDLFDE